MKSRGLRLTWFVVFLAAIGGTAFGVWTSESDLARLRDARIAYADQTASVAVAIADLRAAQQACVAAGQSVGFWSARVTAGMQAVRTTLEALRASATQEAARAALDRAASVMGDFGQVDRRAREHLVANESLLASDLIFTDGLEMLRAASARLDEARTIEDSALAARWGVVRTREAYLAAGAAALSVLVALLLLPAVGREPAARAAEPDTHTAEAPAPARFDVDEGLRAALDARLSGISPPEKTAAALRVDLRGTAELCTDLARLADPHALPGLVGRAARLLDASGIVVWIADPTGAELLPSLAHGYPSQTITRLGALRRDADNATAAAYRSGRLQVVAGGAGETGAVIAPLLSVNGCIGVMAVEVRNQREKDEAVRATAGIFAAQLATLVWAAPAAAAPAESKAGTTGS
jgi:hypothetical protein